MKALAAIYTVRQCRQLIPAAKRHARMTEEEQLRHEFRPRHLVVRVLHLALITAAFALAMIAVLVCVPYLVVAYLCAWFATGARPEPTLGLRSLELPFEPEVAGSDAPPAKKYRVAGRTITGRSYTMDDVADMSAGFPDEEPF